MQLVAKNISKKYNQRLVIDRINFDVQQGECLVITGPNGSGKSTLVKIITGLVSQTSGHLEFFDRGNKISREKRYGQIGLVGPYLQLYGDLTAWENLSFFARLRDGKIDKNRVYELMALLGLKGREFDVLKTYSSGMLQRIKYVVALYHQPRVLVFDEPTANLDEEGSGVIYDMIEREIKNRLVIIATNETEELRFGTKHVDVS